MGYGNDFGDAHGDLVVLVGYFGTFPEPKRGPALSRSLRLRIGFSNGRGGHPLSLRVWQLQIISRPLLWGNFLLLDFLYLVLRLKHALKLLLMMQNAETKLLFNLLPQISEYKTN